MWQTGLKITVKKIFLVCYDSAVLSLIPLSKEEYILSSICTVAHDQSKKRKKKKAFTKMIQNVTGSIYPKYIGIYFDPT